MLGITGFELGRLGPEGRIVELAQGCLVRVGGSHEGAVTLEQPLVAAAEDAGQQVGSNIRQNRSLDVAAGH